MKTWYHLIKKIFIKHQERFYVRRQSFFLSIIALIFTYGCQEDSAVLLKINNLNTRLGVMPTKTFFHFNTPQLLLGQVPDCTLGRLNPLLRIKVEETQGLERSLEYITIKIPRLKPSQKDYQLYAYTSNSNKKIPIQIVDSKHNKGIKGNQEMQGIMPISLKGHETKEYFIKAVPYKNVMTETDLIVKGSKLDVIVENTYYAASLKEYTGFKQQKLGSGQLGSLTLKEFNDVILARKNPNLKIHWAPNFSKENLHYKTMAHLNSPDSVFVSTKGPFYFSLFRSGKIEGYEKILLKGKYKFYAGLPYFTFESEILFTENDSLNLLRNDEMTMDSLFTHLAFSNAGKTTHLPLYDDNSMTYLDKNPIPDNAAWLFFYNKNQRPLPKGTNYASENTFSFQDKSQGIKPTGGNKSYAFGSIRIEYNNKNIHGNDSPTYNKHTKITASANNGRYWNRRLIDNKNTFVPKGSKYTEKNAYILFKIDEKDPEKTIKYYYERLKNPVLVRYIR